MEHQRRNGRIEERGDGVFPRLADTARGRRRWTPLRDAWKEAGARSHHEEFQGIGAKVRTGTSVPVRQVGQRLRVWTQARKSDDGVAGSGGGAWRARRQSASCRAFDRLARKPK